MPKVLKKMFMLDGLLSVCAKLVFDRWFYVVSAVKDIYESSPFKGPKFMHCELQRHKLSKVLGMSDSDILDVAMLTENIKNLWEKNLEMVYKRNYRITYYEDKVEEIRGEVVAK